MAFQGTLWQHRPGYLAATNTATAPGDPLLYDVPRPFPVTDPDDRTSYHPGQRTWSIDNLPDILYQIYPDLEWYRFMHTGLPEPKVDRHGWGIYESWPVDPKAPRMLLDFPILPDEIGTKEHYIFIEIWRRWDPRIRLIDITMRMNYNRPSENALNSALQRVRLSYNVLSWHQIWRNIEGNKNRDKVIASLPMCAIEANSSRGHTPGLVIPWMGEDGGRIPHTFVRPHQRSRFRNYPVRDGIQGIQPVRAQRQYGAPEVCLEITQRLRNYNPQYENLFHWDEHANDAAEDGNYGNIQTMARPNTYFPTAQPDLGIGGEHDIQGTLGIERPYGANDRGEVEVDNNQNEYDEMIFLIKREAENDGRAHNPGNIEGGLEWSGHEAQSRSFCWNHSLPTHLDPLPFPSANPSKQETP
ncbi:hypothetical protein MMC17_003262 [Xylographa soralifera]|nr:hypothetical protein [Xylographa soralifera]